MKTSVVLSLAVVLCALHAVQAEEPIMPSVSGETELITSLTKVGYTIRFGGPFQSSMRFAKKDGKLTIKEDFRGSGIAAEVEYGAKIVATNKQGIWTLQPEYPEKRLSYMKTFYGGGMQLDAKTLKLSTSDGKRLLAKPHGRTRISP